MSVEEKRISLNEIVNEVFKSKLMLFLILLVTIILTLFFAFNVNKPRWTGNLKIEKISSIDHNDFMALKEFDEIYSIKKDYLAKLFIEEIKNRSGASKIIDRLGIIDRSKIKNEEDYLYEVKKEAFQIEISIEKDEELSEENQNEYYVIEYSSYNYDNIIKIISFICDDADRNVKDFLIRKFDNTVNTIETSRKNQIQDIEKALENSLVDIKNNNDKRIAFLREQSEIAKSLALAENQLESQAINKGEDIQPYYLRGYVAIDREIELIESRSDISLYVDNTELENEKRILEQDLTTNRLLAAFNKTPISKDTFRSANYDIANIQISRSDFGRAKILIIGLFVGFILSCIFIIFKIYLRKDY